MSLIFVSVTIISCLYSFLIGIIIYTWKNEFRKKRDLPYTKEPSSIWASVIVAVRNEEQNVKKLLKSLAQQTFRSDAFEVIIINDHSTDHTIKELDSFCKNSKINIRVLNLLEKEGKKAAITQGIHAAKGKYVFCTDGDCIVPKSWLSQQYQFVQNTKAKFVCSPVLFHDKNSIFNKMQNQEFASIMGVTGASILWKAPTMCNGANICYERELFIQENGFEHFDHLASGDDEFLMHKASLKHTIYFNGSKEVLVKTKAHDHLKDFYHQRLRWTSKWKAYKNISSKLSALAILFIHCIFIACLILSISTSAFFIFPLIIRAFIELLLIVTVQKHYHYPFQLKAFFILQGCYSFYVVYFAILGQLKKSYLWKNRIQS